jgi:hypothetical protein
MGDANRQTSDVPSLIPDCLLHPFVQGNVPPGVRNDDFALFRRFDFAARAIEYLDVQLFFQLFDVLGDSGLR